MESTSVAERTNGCDRPLETVVRAMTAALMYRYRGDARIDPKTPLTERPTIMLREVRRGTRAAAGEWSDPPLPETVEDRHRIATTLMLLALVGLAGLVVSLLAG